MKRREAYARQGYALYRDLLSHERIDALLVAYADSLQPSRLPLLRQSADGWQRHRHTQAGHIADSLLNPHCLPQFPLRSFVQAALNIYADPAVHSALHELNGDTAHTLAQSMFFDANTATPAHQDCYYLDSLPGGRLLGAWFALEDIDPGAGRFYVLPGSHLNPGPPTDSRLLKNHRGYSQSMRALVAAQPDQAVFAPDLKKGDVLFWHVNTIHGSQPTTDPQHSRKSLTGHYLPTGSAFGNVRGRRIRRRTARHGEMPYFQWNMGAPAWPGVAGLYSAVQRGQLFAERLLHGRTRD